MLFVFLPDSSKAAPEDASGFRGTCAEGEGVCGSTEVDIRVEIESVDIDLGRKNRGRPSPRDTRSSRNARGLREEISGTEPRRGTETTPEDGFGGGKLLGRGWRLCARRSSEDEGAVEGRNGLGGDMGEGGE